MILGGATLDFNKKSPRAQQHPKRTYLMLVLDLQGINFHAVLCFIDFHAVVVFCLDKQGNQGSQGLVLGWILRKRKRWWQWWCAGVLACQKSMMGALVRMFLFKDPF